jgi:hypothetical protein
MPDGPFGRDVLDLIAERKIREAIRRGELDDLRSAPSFGKPQRLDDLAHVPPALRSSVLLLRNAGVLPEEVELRRGIRRIEDLLEHCTEPEEVPELRRRLSAKKLRLKTLLGRLADKPAARPYLERIPGAEE